MVYQNKILSKQTYIYNVIMTRMVYEVWISSLE